MSEFVVRGCARVGLNGVNAHRVDTGGDGLTLIDTGAPILLLIALGFWLRRASFISESAVGDLRTLVVNLALPAVLFTSFLEIEFDPCDAAIVIGVFVVYVVANPV